MDGWNIHFIDFFDKNNLSLKQSN